MMGGERRAPVRERDWVVGGISSIRPGGEGYKHLQPQRVQKGGEVLHDHQHAEVEDDPRRKRREEHDAVEGRRQLARGEALLLHHLLPEELWQGSARETSEGHAARRMQESGARAAAETVRRRWRGIIT